MLCQYCHKESTETSPVFCPFCGHKYSPCASRGKRGNGQGTAYKDGKTWTVRVTLSWKICDDGTARPIRKTKSGFKTKKEALEYAPTLLSMPEKAESNITFQKLYLEWKEEYQPRIKHSTMLCYTAAYSHSEPMWYRKFIDIKVSDLQECINNCKAGKRTKENMKAFYSLLYKYAMQNELVMANRSESLFTGNDEKTTRDAITADELNRIMKSENKYAPYVVCLCFLGFRPGELLALKKDAYNPSKMAIKGGGKTKAGTDRIVPVSPVIVPILSERMAFESEYLFPRLDTGNRMTDAWFREKCFEPLMAELGITGKVPYSCRHTFANMLKAVKGSNTDKAAMMGHTKIEMTEYYQSEDYDSMLKIAQELHPVG